VLKRLATEHEGIDLVAAPEHRHNPLAALGDGKLEVAIVSVAISHRDLTYVGLGADEWTLILPQKHPLAAKSWIAAAALRDQVLLVHDAPRSDVERLRAVLADAKAPMPRALRVPLTELLVQMVEGHVGVGLVSRWAIAEYERAKRIVARRLTRGGLPEQWSAAYPKLHRDALVLRRVAELVREEMALPKRTRDRSRVMSVTQ
jgi:LysR family transcriptional regulator for metE and metH